VGAFEGRQESNLTLRGRESAIPLVQTFLDLLDIRVATPGMRGVCVCVCARARVGVRGCAFGCLFGMRGVFGWVGGWVGACVRACVDGWACVLCARAYVLLCERIGRGMGGGWEGAEDEKKRVCVCVFRVRKRKPPRVERGPCVCVHAYTLTYTSVGMHILSRTYSFARIVVLIDGGALMTILHTHTLTHTHTHTHTQAVRL
jgi:hypothetical protein